MTDISLIIPFHNRKELLPRLFEGIRRIEGCEVEVIFVDNNSEVSTRTVVQDFINEPHTPNLTFKLLTELKAGSAAARNTGLDAAVGEYVYFFDSDDELTPSMLPAALDKARKEGADIVAVQINHIFSNGKIIPRRMVHSADPRLHIVANNFATQSLFLRREFAIKHGRWDETLFYWNDFELALRLLLHKPAIAWLSGTYHKIYRHSHSITGNNFSEHIDKIIAAHNAVEKDIINLCCPPDIQRRLIRALNCRKALYAGHIHHEKTNLHAASIIYNSINREAMDFFDHLRLPLLYRLSAWGVRGVYRLT